MPTVIYPAIPVRDTRGEPLIELRGQSGTVVARGTDTPLTLVDVNGLPMSQPLVVTALGFLPTFGVVEGLEEADFVSGSVRMPIDSPTGLRDSAAASALAAEGALIASRVAAASAGGGPQGTWAGAWSAHDIAALRAWFAINTGPRGPMGPTPITGEIIITAQEAADALVGRVVHGHIIVTAPNIELRDFVLIGDGHPILIDHRDGSDGLRVHHVEIDCLLDAQTVRCISGTATNITVEYCNLHDLNDGASARADSVYRYNWVHTPIVWQGTWVSATDPHTDGFQVVGGSNILIERNFVDISPSSTANIISCVLIKSDAEAVSDVVVRQNYLNGGGRTVRVDKGTSYPIPTGVVIDDNRMGDDFYLGLWSIVAGATVTQTANIWATTRTPVPLDSPNTWDHPSSPRNITDLAAPNSSGGEVRVSRNGDVIELRLKALILTGAGTVVVFTLPAGYRPTLEVNDRINLATASRSVNILRDGKVTVYGVVAGDNLNYSASFRTSQPWPTTPPGTAVYTS